jgi:hypothetical protein
VMSQSLRFGSYWLSRKIFPKGEFFFASKQKS